MLDPPVQCVAGIAASCTINSFGKSCPEAAAYMIIPIYSVLHVTCCLTHVYVLLALFPKASKAFANPTPPYWYFTKCCTQQSARVCDVAAFTMCGCACLHAMRSATTVGSLTMLHTLIHSAIMYLHAASHLAPSLHQQH